MLFPWCVVQFIRYNSVQKRHVMTTAYCKYGTEIIIFLELGDFELSGYECRD